jgi:hypothetical protein
MVAAVLPVLAVLAGCINTDPAVFVDPTLSAPAATVSCPVPASCTSFGFSVSGGFDLDLHLGARASGPSTVTLESFSILDAQMKGAIVPVLMVTSSIPFPATVQPNSDVTPTFTFSTGTATQAGSEYSAICDAAGVVIGGTIQDSLLVSTPTPFYSPVFHPGGCM